MGKGGDPQCPGSLLFQSLTCQIEDDDDVQLGKYHQARGHEKKDEIIIKKKKTGSIPGETI